jgi:hypothetical protein
MASPPDYFKLKYLIIKLFMAARLLASSHTAACIMTLANNAFSPWSTA